MFGIPVRHPEAAPAVSGILRVLGRTAGEHSAAAGRVKKKKKKTNRWQEGLLRAERSMLFPKN
jgi:hypothetical protein